MNANCKPATARQRFPFTYGNLFPAFFNDDFFRTDRAEFVPAVNISENEKGFGLEVSVPGFAKEDFKVSVENNMLTISGEHKTESAENNDTIHRREFRKGSFSRSFRLPENKVMTDAISARYENGILMVFVPKKTEEPKKTSREISIA